MYTDVYVDVLFLINLSMDAVSLVITSRLCSLGTTPLRIFFAACIGAVYSVVSVFISFGTYFEIPVFIAVSVLMGCVAFRPDSLGETTKISLVLFISSAILGGVMSALYGVLSGLLGDITEHSSDEAAISPWLFFVLAGVSFFAAVFLCRLHGSGNYPDSGEIEIKLWGKTLRCKGIFDSGNLLRDPLSGRPVVVVRRSRVGSVMPLVLRRGWGADNLGLMSDKERARFRLIPAKGIGGASYLCGFLPDGLAVEYTRKGRTVRKDTNAIFAITEDRDMEVECIIPSVVI